MYSSESSTHENLLLSYIVSLRQICSLFSIVPHRVATPAFIFIFLHHLGFSITPLSSFICLVSVCATESLLRLFVRERIPKVAFFLDRDFN
jgi:hypothetical protein